MDRKKIFKEIENGNFYLQDADEKLKADKEVVLAAVKQSGSALEYANKKLKADKEVVLAAAKKYTSVLEYADKKLRANKKFILAAVKQSGYALQYAEDKLKADKEIVLIALKKDGLAIQFANDKLKVDKEVVLAAVKQDENAVQYAGDKVRFDKSFMKKLLPKEEIFEKYFMDKENLEYKYSVHISGSGGERKAGEISKKTYEFFANDNDLLTSHVYHDENGGIPEDVQIGPWYDAGSFFESTSYSFGDSKLEVDREDQTIEIPMDENSLKKIGAKLIRTKKDFIDGVKKGETGYFFLGERTEKGGLSSELVIDHPFDPKKLKVETCNFNGWETIESITYDNQDIEHHMGDSTFKGEDFQVIEVKN
mgnify:FL=1